MSATTYTVPVPATAADLPAGLRRAAVTLLGLGKPAAAKVLAKLDPDEAAALTRALLVLGAVPAEELRASLVDLASSMGKLADASAPQTDWVTDVLTAAVGADRAREMVADATRPAPFAWMVGADPEALATVLEAESPATVAVVLASLTPELGGVLLRKLTPGHRAKVAARITELEAVPESALRDIDAVLLDQVGKAVSTPNVPVDGVTRLATLLGRVPRTESDQVLEHLRERDPRRAAKVKDQMFTFADVLGLERRYLQKVLAAVEVRTLAVALHGATDAEVDTVFANLPERAAQNLREEVDFLGPVRAADVRNARREIVSVCGSLEAEGAVVRTDTVDLDEDDETVETPDGPEADDSPAEGAEDAGAAADGLADPADAAAQERA